MSVSSVGAKSAVSVQMIVDMSKQLDELRRQLGTGKTSTTYAGLGIDRGLAVSLRTQLTNNAAFDQSIESVSTRLTIAQTTLARLDEATHTVKAAALSSAFVVNQGGRTTDQFTAMNELDQMLAMLNTQVGDQYIYSGKAADKQAVETLERILDGYGSRLGLKDVTAERKRADLGDGLGRLVIPAADAAHVVGSGATLLPDAPATATGANIIAPPFTSGGGTLAVNGTTVTIPDNADAITIVEAINKADTGVTAALDAGGHLVLTGPDAVTPVTIGPGTPALGNVIAEFGLPAGANPTNIVGQIATPSTLTLQVGANPTLTLNFGAGQIETLDQLAHALHGLGGGIASIDAAGNISVAARNALDSVTVGGTAAAAFGLAAGTTNPDPAGTRISLTEDAIATPFGFKLAGVASTLSGATVTGPAGRPAAVDIDLAANPVAGETITFTLELPDGTSEKINLMATTTSPAPEGQFTIGATAAETADNLHAVIAARVGTLARTALTAASALVASASFFDSNPPQRVDGTPETATALRDGTPADTIFWYTGEDDGSPARATATGRIDPSITIKYGQRANEHGIASAIAVVAAFGSMTFDTTDPDAKERYSALIYRTPIALEGVQGEQKIADIQAEIAGAQTTMQSTKDRHQQTQMTLEDMLQTITVAPIEEVSAKILTLQVRLQASLQTTALLAKTSLVNFL